MSHTPKNRLTFFFGLRGCLTDQMWRKVGNEVRLCIWHHSAPFWGLFYPVLLLYDRPWPGSATGLMQVQLWKLVVPHGVSSLPHGEYLLTVVWNTDACEYRPVSEVFWLIMSAIPSNRTLLDRTDHFKSALWWITSCTTSEGKEVYLTEDALTNIQIPFSLCHHLCLQHFRCSTHFISVLPAVTHSLNSTCCLVSPAQTEAALQLQSIIFTP